MIQDDIVHDDGSGNYAAVEFSISGLKGCGGKYDLQESDEKPHPLKTVLIITGRAFRHSGYAGLPDFRCVLNESKPSACSTRSQLGKLTKPWSAGGTSRGGSSLGV